MRLRKGYCHRPPDPTAELNGGYVGDRTRAAVRELQRRYRLTVTGGLDGGTLTALDQAVRSLMGFLEDRLVQRRPPGSAITVEYGFAGPLDEVDEGRDAHAVLTAFGGRRAR